MIQIATLIVLAVFILQQFTIANFNTLFKKKEYDDYPYLKDGVESEHYVIQPISDEYPPSVTYQPVENYFIIEATGYIQKLDAKGHEVFKIRRSDDMELPVFSSYIFSSDGVINLSGESMTTIFYEEELNSDRSLSWEAWKIIFTEIYARAEEVVYGDELPHKQGNGFKVYFKVGGHWQVLFTPAHTTRAYSNMQALIHVLPGYPAKFSLTVPLKDSKKRVFSNRQKEEYLIPDSDVDMYKKVYGKIGKLKLLHYKKEMVDDHIAYTHIPISFSGTAYYKLQLAGDALYFKESAVKPSFKRVGNHFNWFVLPSEDADKSTVSFLEVSYPHNMNASGSNGLYIIREK